MKPMSEVEQAVVDRAMDEEEQELEASDACHPFGNCDACRAFDERRHWVVPMSTPPLRAPIRGLS